MRVVHYIIKWLKGETHPLPQNASELRFCMDCRSPREMDMHGRCASCQSGSLAYN